MAKKKDLGAQMAQNLEEASVGVENASEVVSLREESASKDKLISDKDNALKQQAEEIEKLKEQLASASQQNTELKARIGDNTATDRADKSKRYYRYAIMDSMESEDKDSREMAMYKKVLHSLFADMDESHTTQRLTPRVRRNESGHAIRNEYGDPIPMEEVERTQMAAQYPKAVMDDFALLAKRKYSTSRQLLLTLLLIKFCYFDEGNQKYIKENGIEQNVTQDEIKRILESDYMYNGVPYFGKLENAIE